MTYEIKSTKGSETVGTASLSEAIMAARRHEEEYQPPFGVAVLRDGTEIGEVRDGEWAPANTSYSYRNDAFSTDAIYSTADEAVAAAIRAGDWADLDSAKEARYIRQGSWLLVHDFDGSIVIDRGAENRQVLVR